MAHGGALRAADLGLRPAAGGAARLEDLPLEEVERLLIRKALERHGGNVSHAAKALGLSRSALYRRLQHYGL
jgi:transcriptional regulator of acetoin/glycerol metabolism